MAKERKIKCDCGTYLEEREKVFDNLKTKLMLCPKCGFTTLTKEQARNFIKLKEMHQIIDAKRKIIKIGNSMGITFPDQLHEFGINIGKEIKTQALSAHSFEVEFK